MSVLTRVMRLFPKYGSSPLEDFTTEALVGILEKDRALLGKFTNEFLEVPGKNFRISSQRYYPLEGNPGCIIDIVIENEDTICFIENKVEASEGLEQLPRYSKVLDGFKLEGRKTKLVYCTKYIDEKENMAAHDFTQKRWNQVAKYLDKNSSSNELVVDFVKFLKTYGMSTDAKFSIQDLLAMQGLQNLISKIEEYHDFFKAEFQKRISKSYSQPDNGKQIMRLTGMFITHKEF